MVERKGKYGECPACTRNNSNYSWCQSCDPYLLTKGWTTGNNEIDEIIKSTQLKATSYDSDYLEWIPYDNFKDIVKIGKGGFADIYKATWINGKKFMDINNNKRCSRLKSFIIIFRMIHKCNITFFHLVNLIDAGYKIKIISYHLTTSKYGYIIKLLRKGKLHYLDYNDNDVCLNTQIGI